jgi:hypothetical protein
MRNHQRNRNKRNKKIQVEFGKEENIPKRISIIWIGQRRIEIVLLEQVKSNQIFILTIKMIKKEDFSIAMKRTRKMMKNQIAF